MIDSKPPVPFNHSTRPAGPRSELAAALASCRGAFVASGLLSGVSNVLMLTAAFYMLEIYDRVLPSRSVPTLIGLSILAAALFSAQGLFDVIRGRILVRIGNSLDESLSGRIFTTIVRLPAKVGKRGDSLQPLRDLDSIRGFLSGLGPIALFDLPWIPLYLAICFALHPWIGFTALAGAIILVTLTLLAEALTRDPMRAAAGLALVRDGLALTSQRNAEALAVMGMVGRMADRWSEINLNYIARQHRANDVAGGLGAISKTLRIMLQSGVLGVGAYLVIYQQATAGIIIAGSILSARALAPIDLAIANWKGFVASRQARQRLNKLLTLLPVEEAPMPLRPPTETLVVENASAMPPGGQKLVVQDIHLRLKKGDGLGIIGPSGSGKSSLIRMMVGAWHPSRGKICLDGAALEQWSSEALGKHIGYLPQDVELISGTIAQNIARFDPNANPEDIIAAAKAADVHDLILNLPDGYKTQIGEQGAALSAGQAQRVALARALYCAPFLVVLDEPNSNLDANGEEALTQAILAVRARGGIVVVVAHRPSTIVGVNKLLVMNRGFAQAFGPKEEILSKVLQQEAAPSRVLKAVPELRIANS
jgi:ATP-binding cassette, subfamily C, type I secretion system permease/ATPase